MPRSTPTARSWLQSPERRRIDGLLALLLHSSARGDARRGDVGQFVPLQEQDTGRWSRAAMLEAEHHLARALALQRPGPYQLQAAIQSVHNRRVMTGSTDWPAIAALYDGLVRIEPTQFLGEAIACLSTTQRNQRVRLTGADQRSGRALLRTTDGDTAGLELQLDRQLTRTSNDRTVDLGCQPTGENIQCRFGFETGDHR